MKSGVVEAGLCGQGNQHLGELVAACCGVLGGMEIIADTMYRPCSRSQGIGQGQVECDTVGSLCT